MNRKQTKIFEKASVWKAIFSLAIPAIINILVMIAYNMADLFFIGQLGSNGMIAAVSISSPVFTLLMAFGSMIGGGGCALIARTLGEGEEEKARLYGGLCVISSLVLGLLFGALVFLLEKDILRLLGANAEFESYAGTYIRILGLGAPVMIFSTAMSSVVRSEGAVLQGMASHLLSTVVNLCLDPLFILVLHWDVAGAAIATVLGNVSGAIFLLFYLYSEDTLLTPSLSLTQGSLRAAGNIFALGLPNGTNSILSSFSTTLANHLLVTFGTVAVAAMGASGKISLLVSMVQMGICMGVQPYLAYHYGAKNLPRIRETLQKLSFLTITVGLTALALCLLYSPAIVSLFLKDPAAQKLGQRMVRLHVLTGPFLGLYYISSNFLQASGNAKMSLLVSTLRQGIFFIPLIYVMNILFGVTGNICAHLAADFLAAMVGIILALRQYRALERSLG